MASVHLAKPAIQLHVPRSHGLIKSFMQSSKLHLLQLCPQVFDMATMAQLEAEKST